MEEGEKEEIVLQEGRDSKIYDREQGKINLSKARVTSSRLNSHITLPGPRSIEKVAIINLRMGRFNRIAKNF